MEHLDNLYYIVDIYIAIIVWLLCVISIVLNYAYSGYAEQELCYADEGLSVQLASLPFSNIYSLAWQSVTVGW